MPRRRDWAIDLALVALLTAPAWSPLLRGRLVGTHDGYYHLYRLFELERALRSGDLYPRWAPDFALGYGYPVFDFYPPLMLYLAAPVALVGAGLIWALNGAQLLAALTAGAGMYLLARSMLGRTAAVVAGVLYGSLPYLLIDLYVRGAVAETLALALLPMVAWSLRRVAVGPSAGAVALAALLVGLLTLGHNITSLLALPALGLWTLILALRARSSPVARVIGLAGAGGLGLALGTIYWLPALVERDQVRSDILTTLFYDFHNHFQPLRDVVQRTLLFEYRYDYFAGFLFRAGLLQTALAVLGAALALWRLPGRRFEIGYWAVVGTVALLLQSSRTAAVWEAFPLLGFVQFPWRTLALYGLASTLLAAAGVASLPPPWRAPTAVATVAASLVASLALLQPALLDLRRDEVSVAALGRIELERKLIGTTTAGEYLPRWEQRTPFDGYRDPLPDGVGVEASELISAARNDLRVRVAAPAGGTLVLDRYYFPGWRATVDGRPASVMPTGPHGLLGIAIPAGGGDVAVDFGATQLRTSAALVSAAAALAMLCLSWVRRFGPRSLAIGSALVGIALFVGPATPPSSAAGLPVRADFDGGPRLLGATDDGAGQMTLYWTSTRPVDRALTVGLRVVGSDGLVIGRTDAPARSGLRPSTAWRPGAIVRDVTRVELLPGQPGGEADVLVGLHGAAGYVAPIGPSARWRESCPCAAPTGEGIGVRVGRIRLAASPDRSAPALPRAAGPIAGGRIQLLDYDLAAVDPAFERRPAWAPLTDRVARRLPPAFSALRPPEPGPARQGGPGGVLATLGAGDALDLRLRWQSLADVPDDYAVFTHLLDHRQALLTQDDEWPRRGFSPTSLWRTGQQTLDAYRLVVPPDAPPGRYTLALGMYLRAGFVRLRWSGEPVGRDQVVLGAVKIAPSEVDQAVARPRAARLGAAIDLIGFDDALGGTSVRAGSTLALLPRWRANAVPERDYTTFVHLVDGGGRLAANGDAPPLGGGYPTSLWEPGEQIQDRYQVVVPPDLRGAVRVLIGMYRPDTGERLRFADGADALEAARLEIVP